ncbi:MAG TPA: hypothetical protein VFU98_12170 [Microlunatus sp.]|nr:hypothetical protein [Microlunatus sp.]
MGNLTFAVSLVERRSRLRGRPGVASDPIKGRVTADGHLITVGFSTTPSLSPRGTRGLASLAADQLDRQGLTVRLVDADGLILVELGHRVRAPGWQRFLTRSRLIRVRSVRRYLRTLRGPRLFRVALPVDRTLRNRSAPTTQDTPDAESTR